MIDLYIYCSITDTIMIELYHVRTQILYYLVRYRHQFYISLYVLHIFWLHHPFASLLLSACTFFSHYMRWNYEMYISSSTYFWDLYFASRNTCHVQYIIGIFHCTVQVFPLLTF
jgi:hypothetical protein